MSLVLKCPCKRYEKHYYMHYKIMISSSVLQFQVSIPEYLNFHVNYEKHTMNIATQINY